jgi:hypothetical protein
LRGLACETYVFVSCSRMYLKRKFLQEVGYAAGVFHLISRPSIHEHSNSAVLSEGFLRGDSQSVFQSRDPSFLPTGRERLCQSVRGPGVT